MIDSGRILGDSLCSLHDFWTFPQRENFRCTGHATTTIDRGKTNDLFKNASLALYTVGRNSLMVDKASDSRLIFNDFQQVGWHRKATEEQKYRASWLYH